MDATRGSGVLAGLACGDALGRPVEFTSPERIRSTHGRVTDMLADGSHHQPAGTITDDTELALCIARSLVDEGQFDPPAVVDQFIEWYNSDPFDIGRLTASTLRRLAAGGSWQTVGIEDWQHLREGSNAGNGSLMRCAPYGIAFASQPDELTIASRVSSALTHADPRCQWSCVVLNATIAGLLRNDDQPIKNAISHAEAAPDDVLNAAQSVSRVMTGDGDPIDIDLDNTGYVVTTLQAGLYHGLTAETATDAIVDAVMMGGDTDTIGAVAGAIAGARFGIDSLPDQWLEAIDETTELKRLGATLARESLTVAPAAKTLCADGALDL